MPTSPSPAPVLVIGVGSLLRTDDAVGRKVADRVEAMALEQVEVLSLHQLTPEVAPLAADRDLVIIVDAAVDVTALTVRELEIDTSGALMTHHLGPAGLLSFGAKLGWRPHRAVSLSVPVRDLEVGTEVSSEGARLVDAAVAEVLALIGGRAGQHG
ncbi:MAG: hydrogenase maturation protease [Nitriliruptoraceae bacterium]